MSLSPPTNSDPGPLLGTRVAVRPRRYVNEGWMLEGISKKLCCVPEVAPSSSQTPPDSSREPV